VAGVRTGAPKCTLSPAADYDELVVVPKDLKTVVYTCCRCISSCSSGYRRRCCSTLCCCRRCLCNI